MKTTWNKLEPLAEFVNFCERVLRTKQSPEGTVQKPQRRKNGHHASPMQNVGAGVGIVCVGRRLGSDCVLPIVVGFC
jgi:hypothetical protein